MIIGILHVSLNSKLSSKTLYVTTRALLMFMETNRDVAQNIYKKFMLNSVKYEIYPAHKC